MPHEKLPQKYANVYQFADAAGVLFTKNSHWRLTERLVGEIVGLPNSRGILTATDGIQCYIEREGTFPFHGHVQWFVPDNGESVEAVISRAMDGTGANVRKKKVKPEKNLDEYD